MEALEAAESSRIGFALKEVCVPDAATAVVLVERALCEMMSADFSLAGMMRALARKVWVLYPLFISLGLIF